MYMDWRRRLLTSMPDTSADWGFSPTARTSSPQRVRYSSHQVSGTSGYTRYSGQGWLKKAPPTKGMSDTTGMAILSAARDTGWMLVFK